MKIAYALVTMITISCGLADPKVVVYEKENPATADSTIDGDPAQDPSLGLAAFSEHVGEVASTTCAGCHSATALGGKKLKAGDDKTNRATLLAFVGSPCSASKLFKEIGSGHGGGDQTNNLTLAAIQAWVTGDPDCK